MFVPVDSKCAFELENVGPSFIATAPARGCNALTPHPPGSVMFNTPPYLLVPASKRDVAALCILI